LRRGMTANPYLITGPALISFSGGRTSGYMLKQILDAHCGTLPDDVHVCFANTGKEREETLRFVHECGSRWGVHIRWLERVRREKGSPWASGYDEVGYNSASRAGEPFAALIKEKRYLPNARTRICTTELKIRVMRCYAMAQGWKRWTMVIGLRADEPGRVERSSKPPRDRWDNLMPLATAGISNRDVRVFWLEQPFDLDLLPFEGNCDACFLKARPKLFEVERTRPGTLDWWIEQERLVTAFARKPTDAQFLLQHSFAELQSAVRRQPDMFEGVFDNDPDNDAECGSWCGGTV